MSYITYRNQKFTLTNKIKASELDYDRFDRLICRAYKLVGDMPDTVFKILRQVECKAYAEKDWDLFNLIDKTKTRYEQARWGFREDFNKSLNRLIKQKCKEYAPQRVTEC